MKKILISFLFFLLCLSTSARAISWTLISNVCAGSANTTSVTTGAINTTGATLFVVHTSCLNNASCYPTFSDSTGSNTYTNAIVDNDTNFGIRGDYVISPVTNASQTFTADFGANVSYPSICVQAWSGGTGILYDTSNETSNAGTTTHDGGVTPAINGELLVSGMSVNSTTLNVSSVDTGYTIPSSGTVTSSVNHWALGSAYLTGVSGGTYTQATWTASGSANLSGLVMAFKIGSAGSTNHGHPGFL